YFGSRADWKPALNTDQRRASSPASTSAPPATAAPRERRPRRPSSHAPASVAPFAATASLPAAPWWYGSPTGPSRFSISFIAAFSASEPATARRRAGPASAGRTTIAAAAPADAAALVAKTDGS